MKIRYRSQKRLFRKPLVILQISDNIDDDSDWRDAETEDLMSLAMQLSKDIRHSKSMEVK